MNKQTVAIIFGGCSSEYNVSLQSASAVIGAIDRHKYNVITLGIDRTGSWFRFYGETDQIAQDTWCCDSQCHKAFIVPDRGLHGIIETDGKIITVTRVDAAFPVMHGKNGEDGTLQGLLELAGIPIAGCKTLSSALCMDKIKSHQLVSLCGVNVPRSLVIEPGHNVMHILALAKDIGYPLFVKPVKSGSSYGISKVSYPDDLSSAINHAFLFDNQVLIEECICGFEVGCAVLSNGELIISEPDEIDIPNGFFSHQEKYSPISSTVYTPARIQPETAEDIQKTARIIYQALDCSGFARVDMFLTPKNEIIFNEINTIPGFTAHSRYPSMMASMGYSLEMIVNTVINVAVNV
jgi:D-alanine---D-serine ligase